MPPLSHLTYCTPTISKVYLAESLAAAVNEPAPYRLLPFHNPISHLFKTNLRNQA